MASINFELEWWKAGLTLLGVVIGVSVPAYAGYRTAKRLNITNSNIAEITDRASFRQAQQIAVEKAQQMAFAAIDQVREQGEQIRNLMRRIADCTEANIKQKTEIIEQKTEIIEQKTVIIALLTRIENAERRLELHERNCGPKTIEGNS